MTEADLNISQEELNQIKEQLVELGAETSIADTLAEQEQKVATYTRRYTVPALDLTRLTRALALHELYRLLNQVSEQRRQAYEDAMKELEAIRDGKFPDLAPASTPPTTLPGQGAWGSRTKIL